MSVEEIEEQEDTSLLTETPESSEEPVEESSEPEDTQETALQEKIEVMEKRLNDVDNAYKSKQSEFTKVAQDLKIAKAELDAYRQGLQQYNPQEEQRSQEEWKAFLEEIEEDPKKLANWTKDMLVDMASHTNETIRNTLESRLSQTEALVKTYDPERQAVKDVFDKYKDQEWFSELSEDQQLRVAKELKATMPKASKPEAPQPPGVPGGKGAKQASPRKKKETIFPPGYLEALGIGDEQKERPDNLLSI